MVSAKLLALAGLVSLAVAYVEDQYDAGNGVHVPGPYDPLEHRLAFAGPGAMTVSWSTFEHLEDVYVHYGSDPLNLDKVAGGGTSTTYPTSRTWQNHVELTGLTPGSTVYYQVVNTNCFACSYQPTYSFKVALSKGDMTPFTMAVFSDLGLMGQDGLYTLEGKSYTRPLGSNETNTIQSLIAHKDSFDWMLHPGDIGYADYFIKESVAGVFGPNNTKPTMEQVTKRYESMNEQFFDQMTPLSANKPWMVAPGNHEANCDNGLSGYGDSYCVVGQTNFTGYIEHWRMPQQKSHKTNNFWYSFDYGMAHFVSLDTETDLGHGLQGPIQNISTNHNGPFGGLNEQVDWLVEDLKSVDRTVTPWLIVQLHRPWYTQVSPPTWPAWQEAFEKIFFDYGVDVYVQGHVHTYERIGPIFNGTVDPNGLNNPRAPLMLLVGNAGHYDGLDTFSVPNNYTGFGDDTGFGWGRMTFDNCSSLSWEFRNASNSQVIDSISLFKEHAGCVDLPKNTTVTPSCPSGTSTTSPSSPSVTRRAHTYTSKARRAQDADKAVEEAKRALKRAEEDAEKAKRDLANSETTAGSKRAKEFVY
ncbi:acid phosphatase [Pseudohyphozyma bogoriensis]|nr:acid phosphatase [Pseudohyphozyma bogoriensis]